MRPDSVSSSEPGADDAFETAPCGLGLLAPDYRLLRANRYLVGLLGAEEQETLLGRPLQAFVSPASRIFLQTRLLQSLALAGSVEELALDFVGPHDSRTPVMLNACQERDTGDRPGLIRLAVSRAPRRRAYEAEIPKARQELEAERRVTKRVVAEFVRQAPVPLVMTDRDMRVLGVSDRWELAYGLARSEVEGRLLHAGSAEQLAPDPFWSGIYARALAGESLRGDGPVRSRLHGGWFEWAITPWHDARGEVGGLLLLNFDVTGLIAARDAAAQADAAKTRFLANMSHELRTPLNAILAPIELMRTRATDPADLGQLDAAASAGAALADVLSSLVDFARIENGDVTLRPEPTDLHALCKSVVAFGRMRVGPAPVEVRLTIGDVPAWVVLDSEAVRQILLQLMANAAKFTTEGQIGLCVDRDGDSLVFVVEDTGAGFDVARFDSLVSPFEQGDASITRSHGGVGLGLSIANGLALALGGTLVPDPSRQAGARIRLEIPLIEAEAPGSADAAIDKDEASPGFRVLAVDDNPANLQVLRAILTGLGADTVCATDGAQAVEAAAGHRFDVILMDVQMPVMDGLTAIRLIRAAEQNAGVRTPIIVVSANVSRTDVAAARAAGADDVLGKPVSPSGLIAALMACQREQAAA